MRRAGAVCAAIAAQGMLVMSLAWLLIDHGFPLLSPLIQIVVISLFLGAVSLFWAVRLRTSGGGLAGLGGHRGVLGPWFFSNPIPPRFGAVYGPLLPGADEALAWLRQPGRPRRRSGPLLPLRPPPPAPAGADALCDGGCYEALPDRCSLCSCSGRLPSGGGAPRGAAAPAGEAGEGGAGAVPADARAARRGAPGPGGGGGPPLVRTAALPRPVPRRPLLRRRRCGPARCSRGWSTPTPSRELAEAKLRLAVASLGPRALPAGLRPRGRLGGAARLLQGGGRRSPISAWRRPGSSRGPSICARRSRGGCWSSGSCRPRRRSQAGTVLARVAAGGPPRVEARAAAGDRARLHPGLGVRFVLPGTPEARTGAGCCARSPPSWRPGAPRRWWPR